MRSPLPLWVTAVALVLAAVFVGALSWQHLAGRRGLLDRFETVLLDMRFALRGPRPAPDDLVIVAIDDATIAAEGGFPLPRARLAELVDRIAAGGAQGLAVDLLLLDDRQGDAALARAFATLPTVLAGVGVFDAPTRLTSAVPAPGSVLLPRPALAEAATVGLVNIATDLGGTPRHIPMVFAAPNGPAFSFALRAASLVASGPRRLARGALDLGHGMRPLDIGWHLPLNYYGPHGAFEIVSAEALLDGSATPDRLAGHLVLLGATGTGVGDRFGTPFDRVLPGVEVLATGIANLSDGTGLIRNTAVRRVDVAATAALALCGLVAVAYLPALFGTLLYLALLAIWLVAVTLLFREDIWLSGALPLGGSLPPILALVFVRLRHDRRVARRAAVAREELGRFQSPVLSALIAENPDFLREPLLREAAILFVDLSGFTGVSETARPAKTRDFLRAFHRYVVDVSERNDGIVLNFMGDGAMVGFGLLDQDVTPGRAAEGALNCAFDLVRASHDWVAGTGLAGQIGRLRVGVHVGPVVVSRLGHEHQQQIAATGDTVNVASRLVDLCKDYHASIAASAPLLDALEPNGSPPQQADQTHTLTIRGRQAPLEVHFWQMTPAQ